MTGKYIYHRHNTGKLQSIKSFGVLLSMTKQHAHLKSYYVCVCVCVCIRACVRACVCVCEIFLPQAVTFLMWEEVRRGGNTHVSIILQSLVLCM